MHEDPTRHMGAPQPAGEPPRRQMPTGAKVIIGILVAAVLGLGVALAIVAADPGDGGQELAPAVTTAPTTTAPATTAETTTAPAITETTATTTTETVTETEDTSGGAVAP